MPATAISRSVVHFPAKAVARPKAANSLRTRFVSPSMAEWAERAKRASEVLPGLLADLEAPAINEAARIRLERLIALHGLESATLCIRAIIESEGNQDALIEPVISAVHCVMTCRPLWPAKGLAWIEAFDRLPLLSIVATMRGLDLFSERSLPHYLFIVLRNKLWDVMEPPAPPRPPRKPYVYKRGPRKPKAEQMAA